MQGFFNRPGVIVALSLALGSVLPLTAQAAELDLNVGDKSFSGHFTGDAPNLRSSTASYQFGFLTRPDDEPTLRQFHAQFLVTGDAGAREFDLTAGLGARLLYLDKGARDGFTVAFGGEARAKLPTADRFSLGAYGYIAPSVTSFSDVEGYTQIGVDAAYEIIRGGAIYVGARHVRYKFENVGRFTVDNGMHIGLRLTF
ncbi:YfaZ family outer membrane protein [Polycyclovorans algicola]|uniref:YfaZ family outer membrane protein n=1 Tax=Polycyclovorans algicola TaxID=616992 RepID=UPI0004A6CC22|nr:YfaZ family outer membrane protein [Polycyclovorans algicola]